MPKKTFLNLPEEQRIKIIEAALKEFAEHDFNGASLNNIINLLDVTKGSFYRYFESKSALYDFLVEYVSDKKLVFISESMDAGREDFFLQFRNIMYAYLKFDLSFPLYGKFLFNAKYFNNMPESKANLYKMEKLLKETIRKALEAGTLNREYDTDFIYHCIIKVIEGLEIYIKKLLETDKTKFMSIHTDTDIYEDKDLEAAFNKFIAFLKHGFGHR